MQITLAESRISSKSKSVDPQLVAGWLALKVTASNRVQPKKELRFCVTSRIPKTIGNIFGCLWLFWSAFLLWEFIHFGALLWCNVFSLCFEAEKSFKFSTADWLNRLLRRLKMWIGFSFLLWFFCKSCKTYYYNQ